MIKTKKFWIRLAVSLISFIILVSATGIIPYKNIARFIKYEFSSKETLKLNLRLVNPEVRTLAADSANKLTMRVNVRSSTGAPVIEAHVKLSVIENLGEIVPCDLRTDENGEALINYIPPQYSKELFPKGKANVNLQAIIASSNVKSSIKIELTHNPVVLIHGYQAGAYVFDNMNEYLTDKGFLTSALDYKSQNGIIKASKDLNDFLSQQKILYLTKGFQIERFDIIAHSMGGLVARYYSCSDNYINNSNIEKIIFLSVPQRGSPWAPIGAAYFNDLGIKDLIPDNELFTKKFPSMLNKGLNDKIQIGSILGQYDEVVSPESASIDEWNIKTELFSVGENNFTMNNLLNGNIMEATNHQNILYNKKVFERIETMLNAQLPYPSAKK